MVTYAHSARNGDRNVKSDLTNRTRAWNKEKA